MVCVVLLCGQLAVDVGRRQSDAVVETTRLRDDAAARVHDLQDKVDALDDDADYGEGEGEGEGAVSATGDLAVTLSAREQLEKELEEHRNTLSSLERELAEAQVRSRVTLVFRMGENV